MTRFLFIVGMHRSGTSALAGTALLLGIGAPLALVPGHPSNPKGHFEPQPVVDANETYLAEIGRLWSDCRPAPEPDAGRRVVHVSAFAQTLRTAFEPAPICVLKDPRVTILLPLWRDAVAAAGADAVYAVAFRDPAAVVHSLARRNGWSAPRALAIWLRYSLEAERQTRGQTRTFINAANFIANPVPELARLARDLGFAWPDAPHERRAAIADFIDTELLHAPAPVASPLMPLATVVYDALLRLRAGDDPGALYAVLDRTHVALDLMAPTLEAMIAAEDATAVAAVQMQHADDAHRAALNEQLAVARAQITEESEAHRLTRAVLTRRSIERDQAVALHDRAIGLLDVAARHPWRHLANHLAFLVLASLAQLRPLLTARKADRFLRSAHKRAPTRFSAPAPAMPRPDHADRHVRQSELG